MGAPEVNREGDHPRLSSTQVKTTCPASVYQALSSGSLSSPLLRCKLSRMNRPFLSVCTLAVTVASLFMIGQSLAQNAVSGDVLPEGVVLTELSRPSYPPLARQVRISGDVDLMLRIRQDGSIESAVVISGPPCWHKPHWKVPSIRALSAGNAARP